MNKNKNKPLRHYKVKNTEIKNPYHNIQIGTKSTELQNERFTTNSMSINLT